VGFDRSPILNPLRHAGAGGEVPGGVPVPAAARLAQGEVDHGAQWLKDIRRDRDAALETDRLTEALRRAFACVAGRGRVCVPEDPTEAPWFELSSIEMAFLETLRELAATLDAGRGTSVAADFDAHRDAMLQQMFELAERATEAARQRGRRARRARR